MLRAEVHWLAGDPAAARREAELADDAAVQGNDWLHGAVAVWLSRIGSDRSPRGGIAEPYWLFLDGDRTGAAARWLEIGSRYEAALCLLGADDDALLRRALSMLDGLGAQPAARLCRRRLRPARGPVDPGGTAQRHTGPPGRADPAGRTRCST